jgi:hypothetical protein
MAIKFRVIGLKINISFGLIQSAAILLKTKQKPAKFNVKCSEIDMLKRQTDFRP